MGTAARSVLAVLAGLVAAFIGVAVVQAAGQLLYPLPKGTDVSTPEAIGKVMASIPTGAKVGVVLAWALGAFVGPWVAARLAPRGKIVHGAVVGVLFFVATLANLRMFPHPVWMWAFGLAEMPLAGYLGARLASGRPRAAKPEPVGEPV